MRLKTLPIFLAFLGMGVADGMGPMSHTARTAFHLSNVMAKHSCLEMHQPGSHSPGMQRPASC